MVDYSFHDVLRNGTEVREDDNVNNAIGVVYTVPTGYTLYIDGVAMGLYNDTAADSRGYMYVRDAIDVQDYVLLYSGCAANDGKIVSISFPTLLTVPEDYDICIRSTVANFYIHGFIHGWLL